MGMIPQVTCRNCRKKYSKLKRHCPYCGLERVKHSTRTPTSTAATVKETSASQRARNASKYRTIFGAVILVAIVGCTIAMVSMSIHKSDAAGKQEQAQSEQKKEDGQATTALSKDKEAEKDGDNQKDIDDADQKEGTDDADAADDGTTGKISSISITYLSAEKTEFSMSIGDNIQLDATVYPLDDTKEVQWSSSDTSVLTVTDGLVTGVASGEANVIAICDGVQATCKVLVW
ncbi:MAG: Ig-like domain-containing protein [Oscillospiraceae bacterium]|jgi:phosphate/sulfate permease